MHAGDYFDIEAYTAAWGGLKPMIVGGVNDEFKLPLLPPWWDWLLTRELTGEHPTYRLFLMYLHPDDEVVSGVRARGKIDKKMYGEVGVYQLALAMREKHCPKKLEMGPSTVEKVRRALRDASRRAGGQVPEEGSGAGDHPAGGPRSVAQGVAAESGGSGEDQGSLAGRGC